MNDKRAKFTVVLDVPEGADVEQCREYILNAVQSWRGGIDPDDEMFGLKYESVQVMCEHGRDGGRMTFPRVHVALDQWGNEVARGELENLRAWELEGYILAAAECNWTAAPDFNGNKVWESDCHSIISYDPDHEPPTHCPKCGGLVILP